MPFFLAFLVSIVGHSIHQHTKKDNGNGTHIGHPPPPLVNCPISCWPQPKCSQSQGVQKPWPNFPFPYCFFQAVGWPSQIACSSFYYLEKMQAPSKNCYTCANANTILPIAIAVCFVLPWGNSRPMAKGTKAANPKRGRWKEALHCCQCNANTPMCQRKDQFIAGSTRGETKGVMK